VDQVRCEASKNSRLSFKVSQKRHTEDDRVGVVEEGLVASEGQFQSAIVLFTCIVIGIITVLIAGATNAQWIR
jgi:hypothetical protein